MEIDVDISEEEANRGCLGHIWNFLCGEKRPGMDEITMAQIMNKAKAGDLILI